MDVVVWLRGLGLGQYEAAFRQNEIDETILPNLTAEDLKDLGVGIVGHRREILDAIGDYTPTVIAGNLLFMSGQLPWITAICNSRARWAQN